MRHNFRCATCLAGLLLGLVFSQAAAWQLASKPAEDWIASLERPERIATLKIDEILAKLQLKPGDVVADIGAGPGVFSFPLAKAVSPGGKVYAVEIDQAFLDHITRRATEHNVMNVVTVLGKFADPNLPGRDVDVAFFHDVLHHIQDRAGYLKSLASYMTSSGRIVLIEMVATKGGHKNEPSLQLTKDQAKMWMADAGFKLVDEFNLFEDRWFVIYGRQ